MQLEECLLQIYYYNMKTIKYTTNNIYFTSDLHLYHTAIIKYCNRPFKNVSEMNDTIINNWNNVINKDDIVYVLGDILFGNKEKGEIIKKLNGNINLILGNHDNIRSLPENIKNIYDVLTIKINSQYLLLSHFPFLTWQGKTKNIWNIHGHTHSTKIEKITNPLQYDVGVDLNNFTPVSFDILNDIINNQIKIYANSY
jgi:calcineurin-like phosphoesterase family protein